MKAAFEPHKIKKITALHDNVIVSDMQFKERTLSSGLVLMSDNGKSSGVRPRWAEVYAVGPNQQDIKPGQWICVTHGRWTRGVDIDDGEARTIRKVDVNDILLVSDTPMLDDTISDATNG
jgi:co-chaperonin GroES (HSP10)